MAGGGSFFDVRELELADGPARPEDARRWIAGADPAFSRDQWGLAVVGESVSEPDTLIVARWRGLSRGVVCVRLVSGVHGRMRRWPRCGDCWSLTRSVVCGWFSTSTSPMRCRAILGGWVWV